MALGTALYKLNFQANTDVLKTTRREMAAIRNVAESTASPMDKYNSAVVQLDVLWDKANAKGSKLEMTAKQYKDALAALNKEKDDATGKTARLARMEKIRDEQMLKSIAVTRRNETALERLNRKKAELIVLAKQTNMSAATERREVARLTLEYEKQIAVKKSGGLGPFAGRAASRFAAVGTAAAMGFLSFGAVRRISTSFSEFDKAMARSTAIMDETTDQFNRMEKAAIDTSFAVEASATDIAEGFFFLASAGMSVEDSLKALPVVAQFAQAGTFDLATATDLLTDAQVAPGLNVGTTADKLHNLTLLSDMLTKANTGANASIEQFGAALTNKAAASMKLMNMEVSMGIAVLQAFADQGLKGEEGGTAFAIVTRDLTNSFLRNTKAWKQNGIEIFKANGEYRDFDRILRSLEDRLNGMEPRLKKQILLDLGIPQKSVIFSQMLIGNSEKIAKNAERTKGAWGETAKVADDGMSRITKTVNVLKAGFAEFAIVFGDAFTSGSTRGGLQGLEDDFRDFNKRVKESAPIIKNFGTHVATIAENMAAVAVGISNVTKLFSDLDEQVERITGSGYFEILSKFNPRAIAQAIGEGDIGYVQAIYSWVRGLEPAPELVEATAKAQEKLNEAQREFAGGAQGKFKEEAADKKRIAFENEKLIDDINEQTAALQETNRYMGYD